MNDELLNVYKELPEKVKNNLDDLLSYRVCYNYDSNISDEMVLLITSIAHSCWLKDEYSQASPDYYANYLLDAVYEYGATKEQLNELDYADIVEAYNNERDVLDLLRFNTEDYEYCFTTTDNKKYYSDVDGLYVVDERGIKIQDPHPMADPIDDIFDLLNENKIKDMPLSTHYNIRCIIKNDVLGDKELEERYKNGIENYKKFCKERFIISRDISKAVNLDTDIDITEDDKIYTDKHKLFRLKSVLKKSNENDMSKYSYVASLDNGTDYFYYDNKYIAVDKNLITKEFDDKPRFMLDELKGKNKFVFLSPDESKKIADSFSEEYMKDGIGKSWFKDKGHYAITEYFNYEKNKELDSFTNPHVAVSLTMALAIQEYNKKEIEAKRKVSREMSKENETNKSNNDKEL